MLLYSAMSTEESARYEQTTTVTQHSSTSPGLIDKRYVKSIPGILKLVEMVQYYMHSSVLYC